jgi:hypothetical protein
MASGGYSVGLAVTNGKTNPSLQQRLPRNKKIDCQHSLLYRRDFGGIDSNKLTFARIGKIQAVTACFQPRNAYISSHEKNPPSGP